VAAVAFVSSQTSQGAATTTPTLTLPAGVAAGDVLIAELTLFLNASDTSITAASGWAQIASNVNGTAIRQALYWKVAAGGDANPAFTLTASKAYSGGVSRWTGVDTVRAFTTGAGTASNNTTPTSPTLTIEQPGVTYLHFVGRNSNTVATTAPTNFTTRYAINNASAQVQSYMASRAFAATTGASGTVVSTGDGGANYVVQGVLLYSTDYATFRSGAVIGAVTAASIGITIPAGLAANDIWFAHIFANSTTVTVTAPVSGGTWNSLTTVTNGVNFKVWVFWKRANAGETTNTFTLTATATTSAMSYAYRNAPTTGSPIDGTPSTNSGTGTAVSELSVTPTQTNTTLLGMALGSSSNANLITPDASMFERVDNSHHLQDAVLTAAVASGNKAATLSTSMTWTGVLAALLSTTSVAGAPSGPPFLRPARQLLPLIAR
jgi:hypothetical protein